MGFSGILELFSFLFSEKPFSAGTRSGPSCSPAAKGEGILLQSHVHDLVQLLIKWDLFNTIPGFDPKGSF